MAESQSLEFKAEVQQLLNILSRSLYTEREIFLRELISNASDALNRIQFEMLTRHEVLDADAELAIHLDFDEEAKTLTISDSGIGMNRAELIENLGTIAHSGAMSFLKNLQEGQRLDDIIGQFGVGFYSVFMVADEVHVTTRSYRPEETAWTWTSQGDSSYTLAPAEKADRGTRIVIHLKEDAAEFAAAWRLEQAIKKHSDYVSFPIYVKDKVANCQTALWRQTPSEVEADAYDEFYRQLTLDFEKPLLHLHIVTDSPVDIRSVLFVPRKRERGALRLRNDHGLKLYSRKVLIQEYNKDILPEYMRFIEGVVDSADIPLNVARESVQSNRTMNHIQKALRGRLIKALRGRLIKALREWGEEQPEDYVAFWGEFGAFIKEGVATDYAGKDDLLPLLRFRTSRSEGKLIALEEYVARMPEEQAAIYYILGDDLQSVAGSPHLDPFKARDLEVLYLVDALDAFMVQSLHEYKSKPLQNVDDPNLDLPKSAADAAREADAAHPMEQAVFDALLERVKAVLGARIESVRESKMLTDSPARLVAPGSDPQHGMDRVRRLIDQNFEVPVKILELNRLHPLIQKLAQRVEQHPDSALIPLIIEQLFENLLLIEGLHPNPAQMTPRIQTLLEAAANTAE